MPCALVMLRCWLGLSFPLLWPGAAWADLWAYVDPQGVTRFASEQVDDRYELFLRSSAAYRAVLPGQKQPLAPAEASLSLPRAVAVPSSAGRLAAYFDVSPGYKSVRHHIVAAAQQHDVDHELIKAIIATESGFDASAVSPKGAVGLMQLMPPTAERFGVVPLGSRTVGDRLNDPSINIQAGTRYLRYLLNLFPGEIELVLAAYNAGEGAVKRAGNRVPEFRETRNYVQTVLQIYRALSPPKPLSEHRRAAQTSAAAPSSVPGGAVGRANMIGRLAPLPDGRSPTPAPLPDCGECRDFY
jgi:soluble lytic murein transglycosylase-like protein